MFDFGVDTFIWTESFTEKDLWIIGKAKEIGFTHMDFAIAHPEVFPTELVRQDLIANGITPVITSTLSADTNLISPDPSVRANGILHMKKLVDIGAVIGAKIIGGVVYAAWGYLTGKPRTEEEWNNSVSAMREVCQYAAAIDQQMIIAVECVNRFETHFLNIAADAVDYCKAVGYDNIKVHLDCFHMGIEENSYSDAIRACGSKYLGYMHVNENNRGIPGTGMVPFNEVFRALKDIGYSNPVVIESFDPSFEELVANCAIWRKLAESGEELARQGLVNLKRIASEAEAGRPN